MAVENKLKPSEIISNSTLREVCGRILDGTVFTYHSQVTPDQQYQISYQAENEPFDGEWNVLDRPSIQWAANHLGQRNILQSEGIFSNQPFEQMGLKQQEAAIRSLIVGLTQTYARIPNSYESQLIYQTSEVLVKKHIATLEQMSPPETEVLAKKFNLPTPAKVATLASAVILAACNVAPTPTPEVIHVQPTATLVENSPTILPTVEPTQSATATTEIMPTAIPEVANEASFYKPPDFSIHQERMNPAFDSKDADVYYAYYRIANGPIPVGQSNSEDVKSLMEKFSQENPSIKEVSAETNAHKSAVLVNRNDQAWIYYDNQGNLAFVDPGLWSQDLNTAQWTQMPLSETHSLDVQMNSDGVGFYVLVNKQTNQAEYFLNTYGATSQNISTIDQWIPVVDGMPAKQWDETQKQWINVEKVDWPYTPDPVTETQTMPESEVTKELIDGMNVVMEALNTDIEPQNQYQIKEWLKTADGDFVVVINNAMNPTETLSALPRWVPSEHVILAQFTSDNIVPMLEESQLAKPGQLHRIVADFKSDDPRLAQLAHTIRTQTSQAVNQKDIGTIAVVNLHYSLTGDPYNRQNAAKQLEKLPYSFDMVVNGNYVDNHCLVLPDGSVALRTIQPIAEDFLLLNAHLLRGELRTVDPQHSLQQTIINAVSETDTAKINNIVNGMVSALKSPPGKSFGTDYYFDKDIFKNPDTKEFIQYFGFVNMMEGEYIETHRAPGDNEIIQKVKNGTYKNNAEIPLPYYEYYINLLKKYHINPLVGWKLY